jgi:hypothetical protein
MIEDILSKIRGQRISGFSLVKHPPLDPDRILIHLESGVVFEFKANEKKFGPYEAYTLNADQGSATRGADWLEAGWIVDETQLVKRQDWLQEADATIETVGRNPKSHCWGPIGTAPREASHILIVISAVVLISRSKPAGAMIYLSDYPGLVSFTTSSTDMAAVIRAHAGPA